MFDENENNPAVVEQQQMDRKKIIVELFDKGIDFEKPGSVFAVHATSIEALEAIIKTGKLPTGKGVDNIGYIYFYRLDQPLPGFASEEARNEEIAAEMKAYGRILSFATHFANRLGLDIKKDDEFISGAFNGIETRLFQQYLRNNIEVDIDDLTPNQVKRLIETIPADKLTREAGVDGEMMKQYIELLGETNVINAAAEAYLRKGIIVGFNNKLFENNVEPAEGDDDGWRVAAPDGLSLDHISGILAQGEYESEYLNRLRS